MNLVLMGPPGAGKGTQGEILSKRLDINTISTGVMLRTAIKEQSEIGKIAEKYINDGKLDLVIVKRCSVTDLIALIKDYRFGKHDKSPFIHYVQGQHIHITCDQDLTMDIDGEEGTHLPIDIHNLQKSIQLLVPSK